MKRKKQINAAAIEFLEGQPKEYFKTESERNTAHTGFVMGARWADSHPASPWVNAKERLPEEGQLVFLVRIKDGYNSGCLGFYKWKTEEGYVFGNDQGEFIVKDGDFIVWKEEPKTFDI